MLSKIIVLLTFYFSGQLWWLLLWCTIFLTKFYGEDDSYCGDRWLKFFTCYLLWPHLSPSYRASIQWRKSFVCEKMNIAVTCDLLFILKWLGTLRGRFCKILEVAKGLLLFSFKQSFLVKVRLSSIVWRGVWFVA